MSPAPRAIATANSSSSFSSFLLAVTRASTLSSLGQLFAHVVETLATRDQQHQQVVDQIRDFAGEQFAIVVLRGDDRFRGFLADFLQYLIEALLEQISGV